MSQPALDLVIAALKKIRETTDHVPRASRNTLAQLQSSNPPALFRAADQELRDQASHIERRPPEEDEIA
jgi:hypothetical protein